MLHTQTSTSDSKKTAGQSGGDTQLLTDAKRETAQSQKRKVTPQDQNEIVVQIEAEKKITREDIVEVPICLDSKLQSSQRFGKIIDQLVALGCQNITCILTAELQSINYQIVGFSKEDAKAKAQDDEKRWISKNVTPTQERLKGKTINFGIKHWSEVMQERGYCEAKEQISQKLKEKKYQASFQKIVNKMKDVKLSNIRKRQEGASSKKNKKPFTAQTDIQESVVKDLVSQYFLLEFPHIGSAIIRAFTQKSEQNKVFIAYPLDNGPTITADEKEEEQSLNVYIVQLLREILLPSLTSTNIGSVFLNIKFVDQILQPPRRKEKLEAKKDKANSTAPAVTSSSSSQSVSSATQSTLSTIQINILTKQPSLADPLNNASSVQEEPVNIVNKQKSTPSYSIGTEKSPKKVVTLQRLTNVTGLIIQAINNILGQNNEQNEQIDKILEQIDPQINQMAEQATRICEETASQPTSSSSSVNFPNRSVSLPIPS